MSRDQSEQSGQGEHSGPTGPTRRRVLEAALMSSAALAAARFAAAGSGSSPEPRPTPSSDGAAPFTPPPFELEETTFAALQDGLASGRWTSQGLVEAYFGRIEALNLQGPELRALIETNPDAPSIAAALDAERKAKGARGPLHGIPILVKDNLDTGDRMTTTAGSLALEGSIAPRDSAVAARLRAAGAILLGKANLSEWANFRSDNSSSGWSSRGGQCRNPYALDRSPSGSSSGSGVAVAANLAPAAIGTETDGSIISPSNANSLVGIKPTVGLVSRAGIIPIAHSQDTAGPMCRSVADAAALLGAIAGYDERDPATAVRKGEAAVDYTRFLDPAGLKGARIGVARAHFFGRHPGVDQLMEGTLAALKDAGALLVDPADLETAGKWGESEFTVLLYEFKADLNAYLASLGAKAPVKSLAEVIEFNQAHRDRVLPYFGQDTFLAAQKKGPLTDAAYREALEKNHRLARKEGLDATFAKHRLDALIAPTGGPAWLIDLVNGDQGVGSSSSPCAVSGYPSITVPAGYVRGLPVGVSFMGLPWSEGKLIRMASAFEAATKVRKPPQFRPTADLALTAG